MKYSIALSSTVHDTATGHLVRPDGQEDLCFAVWFPSRGRDRCTALLHQVLLPQAGDRRVHGNVSFLPQYFERALGAALGAGGGVAFLHSHPAPGWQAMSLDDVRAEERLAAATCAATGLPLVGLTAGNDGAWSARFWERTGVRQYQRRWCESARVVGDRLAVTYNDSLIPPPRLRRELTRTVSAWGPKIQAGLGRLRVGIVGAGSVGSIIGESLARMGFCWIRLLDFDAVELINLDRLLHATRRDVGRAKVRMLAKRLQKSATADRFSVEPLEHSVVEEDGFRAALDCDVLFSCVDRPWPRSVLNFIAYAHLIPVVDGGIAIRTKKHTAELRFADMRAHVAAPNRRCLECLGQYDAGLVSAEREGYLDDPTYIAGLPDDHPIRHNENVFPFSVTTTGFEVLQLLSMFVAPLGVSNPGAQLFHFVTGRLDIEPNPVCNSTCCFPALEAKGDRAGVTVTGQHRAAEAARSRRRGFGAVLRRARSLLDFKS